MVANDAWPAIHWAGYIALALVVLGNAARNLLVKLGTDKDQSTTITVRTNTVAHRTPVLLVLPLAYSFVGAVALLGEQISIQKWSGIALIALGPTLSLPRVS